MISCDPEPFGGSKIMKSSNRAPVALRLLALAVVPARALAAPAPAAAPVAAQIPYGAPITLEQARVVAAAAEAEAKRRNVAVTIAIVDSSGTPVYLQRMTGASIASAETAPLKGKSAVEWQRPTSSWIAGVSGGGNPSPLLFPHVLSTNGGEMLIRDGRIIGGIGVGGSGPNEDAIAKAGVAGLN